jgi:MFS transporter, ACS family, tartrate transporter
MTDPAVAAGARRKAYLHVVLPLFFASVIAYLDRVNISYAALAMNTDLGFGPEVYGMGAGVFFAGYFLFEVPGALVAERYSPRLWLTRIMVSWGVVSALMALMRNAWQFYLLRFLLGVAEASLYPVIYASCIPRWFAAADRARAIAVLLTSLQIAGVVGAPLAGWLTGARLFGLAGWQVLFLAEAVPAIVFGGVLPFWIADWPREATWLTAAEKDLLTRRYERELAAKSAQRTFTVLQALRNREVLKLCLIYFLWVTGFWGFNYWMPTLLKEASGWTNAFIGDVFGVAMFVSLLASVYTGHSSSRTGEKRWHAATHLFLAAAALAMVAFTRDPAVLCACMVAGAVGTYAPMSVWWSYPTTFLSGAAAAGAVGLINSIGNLGGFAGPYVTGWAKQTTGSFTGAMVYLALSLAASGLLILTLRKSPPTNPTPSRVGMEPRLQDPAELLDCSRHPPARIG